MLTGLIDRLHLAYHNWNARAVLRDRAHIEDSAQQLGGRVVWDIPSEKQLSLPPDDHVLLAQNLMAIRSEVRELIRCVETTGEDATTECALRSIDRLKQLLEA
jgi:hypothetical protein